MNQKEKEKIKKLRLEAKKRMSDKTAHESSRVYWQGRFHAFDDIFKDFKKK